MKLTENCNYVLELNKDEYKFIKDAVNEKLSLLLQNSNDPAFDEILRKRFKCLHTEYKWIADLLP